MSAETMQGHGGREVRRHQSFECICWVLGSYSVSICSCECHALEDEVES